MILRFFRPPFPARWIFSEAVFRIKRSGESLCLTFDDGPDPGSTPRILSVLDDLKVQALFFCSGKKADEHPALMNEIRRRGHLIGNHGYNHLNGWKTSVSRYCEDARRASFSTSGDLFRPPYGKMRLSQYLQLKKKFRIVLWDLMPYDFENAFGESRSLSILNKKTRPGSVIVLHDTPQSACGDFLKEFIESFLKKGYRFILPF